MTRNDRLLMCMPYRQLVRKAVDVGFRVHAIWDPALESPAYLDDVAERAESMRLVDFTDEIALRRAVVEVACAYDVAHVLHFGEERSQRAVAEAAAGLDLALNAPDSLTRINDKAAMRRLLHACGISPVTALELAAPPTLRTILERGFELPVVAKPTRLDGSRGVRLIERQEDLDAWAEELAARRYTGPLLVEEFLRGPELSVETLTVGGSHHVVGITAKRLGPPPDFVEMGHVHPAPLPAAARTAVVDTAVAFLDATGYRFGPAHTEVILTAAGPRIVESQTRLGGDRIPLLIEVASGFDVEAALFRSLAGKPIEPPPARRLACVSFFDFGSGRVASVAGEAEVRALPFVHALRLKVVPGDDLRPVRDSPSRHGHVVVEASSEGEADERCGVVRELLEVVALTEHAGDRPRGVRRTVAAEA